jgi:PEP-CTERM motif
MKLSKWAGVAALSLAAVGGPAEASVVIDMSEVGGNVVTTGSGTVDLAGLSFSSSGGDAGFVFASLGSVGVGSSSEAGDDLYSGAIGPASFGTGGFIIPFGQSGDLLGLFGNFFPAEIFVPHGYVSGTLLSGSSTYVGQTFASLGLTRGTYLYTWGSGPTADSLTIKIGVAAIPEPGTWAMMMLGFAALGLAGFRAARKSAGLAA